MGLLLGAPPSAAFRLPTPLVVLVRPTSITHISICAQGGAYACDTHCYDDYHRNRHASASPWTDCILDCIRNAHCQFKRQFGHRYAMYTGCVHMKPPKVALPLICACVRPTLRHAFSPQGLVHGLILHALWCDVSDCKGLLQQRPKDSARVDVQHLHTYIYTSTYIHTQMFLAQW